MAQSNFPSPPDTSKPVTQTSPKTGLNPPPTTPISGGSVFSRTVPSQEDKTNSPSPTPSTPPLEAPPTFSVDTSSSSSVPPPPSEEPPIPPNYQTPQLASADPPFVAKKSPFKFAAPVVIGLVVLSIISFVVYRLVKTPSNTVPAETNKTITLTYWGLWESPSIMKPVIDAFQAENPQIRINYQLQDKSDYQDRLITTLKGDSSPDILRLHSTWLPLLYQDLLPAPANSINKETLNANFYPAINQVVLNNQLYGIPLTMEGLGLFINTSIFDGAGIADPVTWEDLKTAAETLTQKTNGKIVRAGVALGNTSNVDYWSDILTLMFLQGGANLLQPSAETIASTIIYYTSFQNGANPVWDSTLPSSTQAFANEKVAAILAPSWTALDIQSINPNLSWKIIPVPQLPGSPPVTWTSYWIESVSKKSKHPQEAWKFLKFLSTVKAQQLLFETATRERGFSQAPANKNISVVASQNPIVAPFTEQLSTAKTFYTASLTHDPDTALNSRLIKYLENAVNATLQNAQRANQAAVTLQQGFNQVLSQYNLVPKLPPTSQ